MSVLLELGEAGDIVIDLLVDFAPKACENFLKLYVPSAPDLHPMNRCNIPYLGTCN